MQYCVISQSIHLYVKVKGIQQKKLYYKYMKQDLIENMFAMQLN